MTTGDSGGRVSQRAVSSGRVMVTLAVVRAQPPVVTVSTLLYRSCLSLAVPPVYGQLRLWKSSSCLKTMSQHFEGGWCVQIGRIYDCCLLERLYAHTQLVIKTDESAVLWAVILPDVILYKKSLHGTSRDTSNFGCIRSRDLIWLYKILIGSPCFDSAYW